MGKLFSCLLILALSTPTFANQPKARVGFRVDRTQDEITYLKPIYPAKIGAKQTAGEKPKQGELITCYVEGRKIVRPRVKDDDIEVSIMLLECLNGARFEVIGIEY